MSHTWMSASGLVHISQITFLSSAPHKGIFDKVQHFLCHCNFYVVNTFRTTQLSAVSGWVWAHASTQSIVLSILPTYCLFSSFFEPKYIRMKSNARGMPNRQLPQQLPLAYHVSTEGKPTLSITWGMGGIVSSNSENWAGGCESLAVVTSVVHEIACYFCEVLTWAQALLDLLNIPLTYPPTYKEVRINTGRLAFSPICCS